MTQLAWIAHPNGHVYWYNDRWYEYTGTTLAEMEGWGWEKVHHPEHVDRVVNFVKEAWQKPEPWELTFPLRSASAEYRWFLTRAVPLRNEAGEIIQWFGTNTDIQNHRDIELKLKSKSDALEQSQDLLNFALSTAGMGTWSIDMLSGKTILSELARKIFGYGSEFETFNAAVDELIHPEDRERVKAAIDKAIVTQTAYHDQCRILKPNGEVGWVDSHGRALYDRTGKAVFLSGIIADITDRKMAELQMQESELRFKVALRNAKMGSWRINLPSGFMEVDECFRKFHHIPKDADLQTATAELAHPEDEPKVNQALQETIQNGTPYFCEYRIKASDGTYKWVAARGEAMYNDKKEIVAISGVAYEIEEQKRTELALKNAKVAAEIANSTKSAFLANMSHEIRTPLAAILGFSSLLKDKTLTAEERDEYIDTIVRNGTSLTRIIDDILDLAKVEAGRLDVEEVPFNLYSLATDAVDLFKDKAKSKDIYLLLNIEDSVPPQICSDPTRLRQILVNLIGNSVKFTEQGGVRVHINAEPVDGGKTKISISVKDTGIGLTSEQKEKLFSPFTQADNSMTRKFGGTGLGLALSRRLSQALSGEITIGDCTLGKGCTFTLNFVAKHVHNKNLVETKHAAGEKQQEKLLDGSRVLVVDDSLDNLFLVVQLLTKNGAEVDTASDGEEGLQKALHGSYDVVLMDIQMPKMDGYQAKKALDQSGYHRPVIALTAHAMSDERQRTQAAGFVAHLTKPLIANELLKTVANVNAL